MKVQVTSTDVGSLQERLLMTRRIPPVQRVVFTDGVTRTPAFMRDPRRACAPDKGIDPDIFFEPGSTEQACYICRRCPFINQCLSYAITHHEEHGVWGGKSRKSRTRARTQREKRCDTT